jgi:hypothetical protein
MGSLHLSCGMFKIRKEVGMFRKEDIFDVNKRIVWWNKNAHFVSIIIENITKCFVYDKNDARDVATDVLLDLYKRVWANPEFRFNLEKIEGIDQVNSFEEFFEKDIYPILGWTYGSKKYKNAILKILRKYNSPVKNAHEFENDLKKLMEESKYNYTEENINNIPRIGFCKIEKINDNDIIRDKTSESERLIDIGILCKAIDKLKDTSNNTILLAFFQQDRNQTVIEILIDEGKYKNIADESEIAETKDTLFKMNSIFRMCLILDLKNSLSKLNNDEQDVIKHAYLTATANKDDLHRADNLYENKGKKKIKDIRRNGTIILKDCYMKTRSDSFLKNLYAKIFSLYSERVIREGLRLEKIKTER